MTTRRRPGIKPGVAAPGMAARIGGAIDVRRGVGYHVLRSRSLLNHSKGGLLADLGRARRSGRVVALGTATDPYQPAEARFQVTRPVLEAAREVPGIRLSITTKSTLVERDAALLAEIGRASELAVNFSITTTDAALARRLEPRAPRPDLRFGAMAALARRGSPWRSPTSSS